ncbi:MAG TPA: hypothetical protein VH592_22250 [Gemmataceae bacterium]|jgi:ABC-type sugar transport system ATPase subunit
MMADVVLEQVGKTYDIVNNVWTYHRGVVMVFQRPALYSHLSVYQKIDFGLRPRWQRWRRLLVTRVALAPSPPSGHNNLRQPRSGRGDVVG